MLTRLPIIYIDTKACRPGPINLPEIESIDAVLNPDDHNYIYFCGKTWISRVYHAFATNLIEHNNNARVYQNALNRSNIYT